MVQVACTTAQTDGPAGNCVARMRQTRNCLLVQSPRSVPFHSPFMPSFFLSTYIYNRRGLATCPIRPSARTNQRKKDSSYICVCPRMLGNFVHKTACSYQCTRVAMQLLDDIIVPRLSFEGPWQVRLVHRQ